MCHCRGRANVFFSIISFASPISSGSADGGRRPGVSLRSFSSDKHQDADRHQPIRMRSAQRRRRSRGKRCSPAAVARLVGRHRRVSSCHFPACWQLIPASPAATCAYGERTGLTPRGISLQVAGGKRPVAGRFSRCSCSSLRGWGSKPKVAGSIPARPMRIHAGLRPLRRRAPARVATKVATKRWKTTLRPSRARP